MLYNTCPTCGFFLGSVVYEFEEKKNKICNNPKLSSFDVEREVQKLIMSLNLRRYCCRMRLMTYKDLVKDLVAPDDSI